MNSSANVRTISIDTGREVPIDPLANLSKETSAQGEKALELSGLAAAVISGRGVVLRDRPPSGLRAMNTGSGSPGVVDVSLPRTEYTAGVTQASDFIGDDIAPVSMVRSARGYALLESIDSAVDEVNPAVASFDSQPPETSLGLESIAFETTLWSLATRLDVRLLQAADFDLERTAVVRLAERLRLLREKRVKATLFDSGSWATPNTIALGATAKWNAGASSDPILDTLGTAREASSVPTNAIVFSETVERHFRSHVAVRNYTLGGGELPRICVGRARLGAATHVWGEPTSASAAVIRLPASELDRSTMRTLRWSAPGNAPDSRVVQGVFVRVAFAQDRGPAGGLFVVATLAEAVVMTTNTAGALIQNVLQ